MTFQDYIIYSGFALFFVWIFIVVVFKEYFRKKYVPFEDGYEITIGHILIMIFGGITIGALAVLIILIYLIFNH
jgi:hypothetical protein